MVAGQGCGSRYSRFWSSWRIGRRQPSLASAERDNAQRTYQRTTYELSLSALLNWSHIGAFVLGGPQYTFANSLTRRASELKLTTRASAFAMRE
jgi:hypothetical protein